MGAAKYNPMSPQFRGDYPREVPLAALRVVEHPTPEWHMEHPDWRTTGEKPPEEHTLVSVMLVLKRIEPSALYPGDTSKWPASDDVPVGPVLFFQPDAKAGQAIPATLSLAEFRKLTPIGSQKAEDKTPALMLEDEVGV